MDSFNIIPKLRIQYENCDCQQYSIIYFFGYIFMIKKIEILF